MENPIVTQNLRDITDWIESQHGVKVDWITEGYIRNCLQICFDRGQAEGIDRLISKVSI